MVKRYFDRLGGPKGLITLTGKGMWGLSREFNEYYCAHVIRWFKANGAEQVDASPPSGAEPPCWRIADS
jgi:hypothetical protein